MTNVTTGSKKFYGKYRGTVTNNFDKDGLGRIKAKVTTVLGEEELPWAMPSVPYAGDNIGMFFIPPEGSNVWIEFEEGDVNKPIFSGCFWGHGQIPDKNYDPNIKMIKTENASLRIGDKSAKNRIEIKTDKNQKIIVNPEGIELFHEGCSVRLTSGKVSINGKNLEVLK